MADRNTLTAVQGSVPGGFQQVAHDTLSESTSRGIPVLATILFLLSASVFIALALTIGKFDWSFSQGGFTIGVWEAVVGLAAFPATIVLHELVHGLAMRMFGARSQYGVLPKQLVFYATAPGYRFRRNSYLLIVLAPLVGLSCLAVPGMLLLQGTNWVALLVLCATFNVSGALGDMCLASLVLRYPRSTYVIDERDGIRVFMPIA